MILRGAKRYVAITAALSVVCGLTGCLCLFGDAVFIRDRNLERSIRYELGKPLGCLLRSDLESLTELHAASLSIRTLAGLEAAKNLRRLYLSGNSLTTITEIGSFANLEFLDLSNNGVQDITALSGLVHLRSLNLDQNPVMDWTPLAANVLAGGFAEGGTVTVGGSSVVDNDGNCTENFRTVRDILVQRGVAVIVTGTDSLTCQ